MSTTFIKRRRSGIRSSVTKVVQKLEAELKTETIDLELVEECLNQLTVKETKLVELDKEIEDACTDPDELEGEVELNQEYLDKLISWKTKAERALRGSKQNRQQDSGQGNLPNVSRNPSVHLPKLNIEPFTGDMSCWQAFWSQFEVAVHKTNYLEKAEKFAYLKSYLKGQAASAIAGLPLSDENYEAAVTILLERFGRRDLVINSHMNKLLSLKPVRKVSDVEGLRRLYDECETQIRSLQAMGVVSDTYGNLLCPILMKMIPEEIGLEFSRRRDSDAEWNVKDLLLHFQRELESRERATFLMRQSSDNEKEMRSGNNIKDKSSNKMRMPSTAAFNVQAQKGQCVFCLKSNHNSEHCNELTVEAKREKLRKASRCYLCFGQKHMARRCRANKPACERCQAKHHKTLCIEEKEGGGNETPSGAVLSSVTPHDLGIVNPKKGGVLLQTAFVSLQTRNGMRKQVRCLLDGGSQRTFVKEGVSRTLNLPIVGKEKLRIHAFGEDSPPQTMHRRVQFVLSNLSSPEQCIDIEALEIPRISSAVINVPGEELRQIMVDRGLTLAEGETSRLADTEIDILIGSDYYWQIVTGQSHRLSESLMALETLFGWTVQGPTNSLCFVQKGDPELAINKVCTEEEGDVSNTLRSFWELESMGVTSPEASDKIDAMQRFESSVVFEEGRYTLSLPWNSEKPELSDNYRIAYKRLKSLSTRERRVSQRAR